MQRSDRKNRQARALELESGRNFMSGKTLEDMASSLQAPAITSSENLTTEAEDLSHVRTLLRLHPIPSNQRASTDNKLPKNTTRTSQSPNRTSAKRSPERASLGRRSHKPKD
jgi:hypothetical protein